MASGVSSMADVADHEVGLYFEGQRSYIPRKLRALDPTVWGSFACLEDVVPNSDVRVPAWFAIKRLGVTKQTFNYWRASGKIVPNEAGEYRWGDVLQVELDMRQSPNSRRGTTVKRPARDWAALDANSNGMQYAS